MRHLPVLALGLCAVAAPAATAQTAATLSADAVVVTVGLTIATLSQLNFGSVPKGVATTVAPNVAAARPVEGGAAPAAPVPPPRLICAATSDSLPRADSLEAVIVELRIGRLASRTVQAFRARTEALIPVTEVLQLGEVAYRLSPEGRLEAVINPGGHRLVIDPTRDTMVLGDRRVRVEPEFLLFRDGLLYVGAERLGDLFNTLILVDWTELTVSIVDPTVFPAGRRAQRQAAREAFLRRAELFRPEQLRA